MSLPFVQRREAGGGRARRVQVVANRVRRDGKFFRLGSEKFHVKGVTYGPFAPNSAGHPLPERDQVQRDFGQIRQLGANCIRLYNLPPRWFLDTAEEYGLKILLDIAWPKNLTFIGDDDLMHQARAAVRHAARSCGNHPALFALSVVNEIPPDLVRFVGPRKVENFIDELADIARAQAPACLVTFANFPTTEYLQPRGVDFVCFNVYLHDQTIFRNYMARLQNIAGDKPLILGEYGVDTRREQTPDGQAQILAGHLKSVFDEGLSGALIFSFTDDWFAHGHPVENWAFGLVTRDRRPKPAFAAVQEVFGKAPQTADEKLPKASIVICSYNGASTVRSCLSSLRKLRYPDYEVIFVDDGSTDGTQEILRSFPEVRNIRQENKGLSFARNVGLAAAAGDVVVYTDSDCEADEDWLYYLCLNLVRTRHAGVGGPNLIPDEGSWVADCVGSAPGGPTHVMIDDRTAEHVPGCNMAFHKWALEQVNGFDPQFRKAGDDVDLIWRLQHQNQSIGFAPSAQVWHYRRNTVPAYLNQQRGYGQAEAMLKYKHPDHFNALGASHWRGRLYGGASSGVRIGSDVIYHGVFGTGLFQTIYRRPASLAAMMVMSLEWHALGWFVLILGLAFTPLVSLGLISDPLIWVAVAMLLLPVVLAAVAAIQTPLPRNRHPLSRVLIAYLHWRQPIVRGWARYAMRLRERVMRDPDAGYLDRRRLPLDPADRAVLRYWHHQHDRLVLLEKIKDEVRAAGWRMRADSGWHGWDLEIYGNRYLRIRLATVTEHHYASPDAPQGGLLTKVRVTMGMSNFCMLLMAASLLLTAQLLYHIWPFSRPAMLIPLIWWTIYMVSRWRVSRPVMGLIDRAAEKAGFYPVGLSPEPVRPSVPIRPLPEPAV
jgi:cellulose synthase/poly-beta-1,6-N-acetylglucosamine synthase-like glycosyltransferase